MVATSTRSLADELEKTIEEVVDEMTPNGPKMLATSGTNNLMPSKQSHLSSHTVISGSQTPSNRHNNLPYSSHIIDFSKPVQLKLEMELTSAVTSLQTAVFNQSQKMIVTEEPSMLKVGDREQIDEFSEITAKPSDITLSVADQSQTRQIQHDTLSSISTTPSTTMITENHAFNNDGILTNTNLALLNSTEKPYKILTTPPLVVFHSKSERNRFIQDQNVKTILPESSSMASLTGNKNHLMSKQYNTIRTTVTSTALPTLNLVIGDKEIFYENIQKNPSEDIQLAIGERVPEMVIDDSDNDDQAITTLNSKGILENNLGSKTENVESWNSTEVAAALEEHFLSLTDEDETTESIMTVSLDEKINGDKFDNTDEFKYQITQTTILPIITKTFTVTPDDYLLFPEENDDERGGEENRDQKDDRNMNTATYIPLILTSNSIPAESKAMNDIQTNSPNAMDIQSGNNFKETLTNTEEKTTNIAIFSKGSVFESNKMGIKIGNQIPSKNDTKLKKVC